MPHKVVTMQRAQPVSGGATRPVMLAICGDSAAGKTTLTEGLANALGPERVTAVCVDDYHRYDRQERKNVPFTPLHPQCNYVDIMEQHLQLLATGQPVLKPVYNHSDGTLGRPMLVEPREFVIVEGLLPLYTRLSRACFDITVFLDPPEEIRRAWKIKRDCSKRGYTEEQVLADLERREPDSAEHIRPQRRHADIVVRFAPLENSPPGSPLSATLLLRPTIPHPDLSTVCTADTRSALHLKLVRDEDGKPVDALHVHGHAPREVIREVEEHVWSGLGVAPELPTSLGMIEPGVRTEPLAVTQLVLLYHMLQTAAADAPPEAADGTARAAAQQAAFRGAPGGAGADAAEQVAAVAAAAEG